MEPPQQRIPQIRLKIINERDMVGIGNVKCSICLNNFGPQDEGAVTHCNHLFDIVCIDRWLLEVGSQAQIMSELQARNKQRRLRR